MSDTDIDGQQLAAEKFWSRIPNLPAVENNRIYVLESDSMLRLGPRIGEGVRKLVKVLHHSVDE
jgi:ABC-type Fe3+-hydroxamate transport system substrate-binding protein